MICQTEQWYMHLTDIPADIASLVNAYVDNAGYEGEVENGGLTIDYFGSEVDAEYFEEDLLAEFPSIGKSND